MQNLRRWLLPGMHVKRWLALLTLGLMLVSIGLAVAVRAVYVALPTDVKISDPAATIALKGLGDPWREILIIGVGLAVAVIALTKVSKGVLEAVQAMSERARETYTSPAYRNGNGSVNGSANGKTNGRGAPLVDIIHAYRFPSTPKPRGPRIVCIGGGTGMPTMLRGLKQVTDDLTAVVTMADDGGSSGRIREEFGMLPPGDIRNNLVALAETEPLMGELFQYRFKEGSLEGHSFGNLFIVALTDITGSFEQAVRESSRVLAVKGRVLPTTLANLTISAQMSDGTIIRGESNVGHSHGRITRMMTEPANAPGYPDALRAIDEAELIVLGPGSLYTSVIPNLLVQDIARAVSASPALKVYICNVATQPGETDGMSALDHVRALQQQAGDKLIDYCIVNSDATSAATIKPEMGISVVTMNPAEATAAERTTGIRFVLAPVVSKENPLRHDPDRLTAALLDLYSRWQALNDGTARLEEQVAETGASFSLLHHHLINVAPHPILTRLERLDDRVVGGVEVLGGVLVLRVVAAANIAAAHALAQVYPGVAGLQAVFAAVSAGLNFVDLVEVRAGRLHFGIPFPFREF